MRLAAALVLIIAGVAEAAGTWTDLGYALPGTFGLPQLQCHGSLLPDSSLVVDLSNTLPAAKAYLVIGASAIYAPYKGGVLVPSFDLLVPWWADGQGDLQLSGHWPGGLPSGIAFYMQFWIDDPAAVAGRAGSNAVMGLTP